MGLVTESLSLGDKVAHLGPAILPVVLVDNLGHKLLKMRLSLLLLLLFHLHILCMLLSGKLHARDAGRRLALVALGVHRV